MIRYKLRGFCHHYAATQLFNHIVLGWVSVSAVSAQLNLMFLSLLCTSLSALLRDHVAEVHKGRKPLRCEVPGCDFYTLCDRPGKFMRKHIREGLHGKFGKRKPLPEVDKDALALKYKGIV